MKIEPSPPMMAGSIFIDFDVGFLYLITMTNEFNTISAESNLRDKITVRPDETGHPYDGPMGIFEDYEGQDTEETVEYEYPGDDTIEPDLTDEERMEHIIDMANSDSHDEETEPEPDDSMDGDFDSGMASAGFGTDESYGYYGGDEGE